MAQPSTTIICRSPADTQAGFAAWTASWTTSTLNVPLCPAGAISPFLDPCDATLSFANAQGAAVGPSVTVNLSPGQSQSLDLTSAMLNVGLGKSVAVQPMVQLQAPISAAVVAAPACMVASDVFDPVLGRTWTYQIANVQ